MASFSGTCALFRSLSFAWQRSGGNGICARWVKRPCLGKVFLTACSYAEQMATSVMPLDEHDDRDTLTGLSGLESTRARLRVWQEEAREAGETAPIHGLLLGFKRFDTINVAFGKAAGDSALVEVAARILRFAGFELDGNWIASRLSGGTFFLAANEPCSRERWQWLSEALADAISRPIESADQSGVMRLGPRMALVRALPKDSPDLILDRLSQTLVQTQQGHAKRILWVDGEVSVPGRSARELEADLLAALDRDEIEILYQPQYACADDALVGAEALARWQHPELGRIGAGALFAIAERADHLAHLSHHIAKRAIVGAKEWPDHLRLSLNVTSADMATGGFAARLCKQIEQADFPANRLTIEIVEQALLTDLEGSAMELEKLVEFGARVALDDFGAGFCNFRYLKLLPLHYLKLDRSMVEGITRDERDLAVFRGVVAMAHALDLSVIAEGIENDDQRAAVKAEGCEFYQGFLRAAPMGPEEFLELTSG